MIEDVSVKSFLQYVFYLIGVHPGVNWSYPHNKKIFVMLIRSNLSLKNFSFEKTVTSHLNIPRPVSSWTLSDTNLFCRTSISNDSRSYLSTVDHVKEE